MKFERYRLPDGSIISVDATASRGDATITHQLKGGQIVTAAYVDGQVCRHANNWYFDADGDGQCFECWRKSMAERRQAVRDELASLLAFGVHILERWPSGVEIEWSMTPDGRTHTVHRSDIGGTVGHSVQTNAYPSTRWNAAALAEHLESRAFGLGFTLLPYCINCGVNLAGLKTSTDTKADPDPICQACAERRAEATREQWESHGREI